MPSSYVIGKHFEGFIKSQIQDGRYTSASEIIRDALRMLEEREQLRTLKMESLRTEIQRGINSGAGKPIEEVTDRLKTRYQKWVVEGEPTDAL